MMQYLRLDLAGGAQLTLYRLTDPPPSVTGLVYPWLLDAGAIRRQAWLGGSGIGNGETPSMSVTLSNVMGQFSRICAHGLPLRRTAYWVVDGVELFTGVVASIAFSTQQVQLDLEI